MLPVTITHDFYKSFVIDQLRSHYTGEILKLLPAEWLLIEKYQYKRFGPTPADPASLLRSFLLMLFT